MDSLPAEPQGTSGNEQPAHGKFRALGSAYRHRTSVIRIWKVSREGEGSGGSAVAVRLALSWLPRWPSG